MDIYIAIELEDDEQVAKLNDWDLPAKLAKLAKRVEDLLGAEVELVDGGETVRVKVTGVCGVYKGQPDPA